MQNQGCCSDEQNEERPWNCSGIQPNQKAQNVEQNKKANVNKPFFVRMVGLFGNNIVN